MYTKYKIDNCEFEIDKLGGMGSCLINNVLKWMQNNNLNSLKIPWDLLFNPFSINFELQRLFDKTPWEPVKIGNHEFCDPWRSCAKFDSLDELQKYNAEFDIKAKSYLQASKGFVISLEFSEVWYLLNNPKLVLNTVPLDDLKTNTWEQKWGHTQVSVEQVSQIVTNIIHIIRKYVSENCLIVFMVGPISLKFTYSGLDLLEANDITKSTLFYGIHEAINNEKM